MNGPYRVVLTPRAQRQLRGLPPSAGARVRPRIVGLAFEPRSADARPPVDQQFWRIRVGDLRVIYQVDDEDRTVEITRVARRSESTYRRL